MSQCSHARYRSSSSLHQLPILQYADDACLTASSKANCQAMLDTTQKWLDWSLLKAKVPKCAVISICGHPGQCSIPFLGSNLISFLGLPLNAALSMEHIKDQTLTKLETYLHATWEMPLCNRPVPTLTPAEAEDLQGCHPSSPVMARLHLLIFIIFFIRKYSSQCVCVHVCLRMCVFDFYAIC